MRRSLTYFWQLNLAVVLAAGVACAVLTGALLVGDSVRGSLRDLTLERLGRIDFAVLSDSFFRQALGEDLANHPEFSPPFSAAVPALLVQGSAIHAETRRRASRINIQGVDTSFIDLFPDLEPEAKSGLLFEKKEGQFFPSIVVNEALLRELSAKVGDDILLFLQRPSDIPRETLLGSAGPEEVLESVRLTISGVLPNRGVGRFGLTPHQSLPLTGFVALGDLQRALDQRGRVNAIFVAADARQVEDASGAQEKLDAILRQKLALEDLGLRLAERDRSLLIESREIVLEPKLVEAIRHWADEKSAPVRPILTYLANTMERGDRMVPYSTIVALRSDLGEPFEPLTLVGGEPAPPLEEDEILLNEWAAADLDAAAGDAIEISYYEVGPREELHTRTTVFRLRGIVALQGLGADGELTPEFPGIHDAHDMSEWDPPFPVDLKLVRSRDEDYWDRYRATPKAFVAEKTGLRLWTNRFGSWTSLRLGAPGRLAVADLAAALRSELPRRLTPREAGFAVQAVKEQGLRASAGATPFGLLFLSFSFFLIISAALLVGLFFRLGVEERASEVGLLLAVGTPIRQVRRRFLGEGAVLAGVGVLLGVGGGVLYAGAMMAALRTWWQAAVGSPYLFLHVGPLSLVLGAVISFGVVLFSIWRTVRRLGAVPATALMRGVTLEPKQIAAGRRTRLVAPGALGLAGVLLALAGVFGAASSAALFFGSGACLVVAGLVAFSVWIRGSWKGELERGSVVALIRMAAHNAALNPGRSLLSATLVAAACFVIVAVAANGLQFGEEVRRRESGAGGFSLVAESDVPVHQDLNRAEGRYELGFSDADSEALEGVEVVPFRLLPGDDVSCLNLYQPEKPRLVGVPPEQIERGGFHFQSLLREAENPWSLLTTDDGSGTIPVFGDYNSMLWILKLGLGKELVIENEFGEPIKLRLVGTLRKSLFQAELLMSEENFLRHFPSQSGYSYFLIDPPEGRSEEASRILEKGLGAWGFDTTPTAQRLANFQAVENTYLATFQTLGGLGLLLGTFGLAAILLRNIVERRGELATLRALGFRRASLAWIVVAENGLLLIVGVGIGSLSALVAMIPHLTQTSALVPWGSLIGTLLVVIAVGMIASTAAVFQALRAPLLATLRAE